MLIIIMPVNVLLGSFVEISRVLNSRNNLSKVGVLKPQDGQLQLKMARMMMPLAWHPHTAG